MHPEEAFRGSEFISPVSGGEMKGRRKICSRGLWGADRPSLPVRGSQEMLLYAGVAQCPHCIIFAIRAIATEPLSQADKDALLGGE